MIWPNATDFINAVQDLQGSMEDEELRAGEAVCTPLGLPMLWSGNFADVFKVRCPASGQAWALKCFTRPVRGLQDRYRCIAAHLEQAQLPFTVDFRYLEHGIRIRGAWFPLLKMRWVEGLTLTEFVEEHLERPANLKMLLDLWVKLAARLREAEIAHADLQHGNVLLVPASGGSLALRLIDYDGMYVPSLDGTQSGEVGHPAYQHPQRLREGTYNAELDRFSHLAIYCGIRCLMLGRRELWQRFNNGDNLLFREADYCRPGESEVFQTLWRIQDADARAMVGRLILACGEPLEQAPLLDEVVRSGRVAPLTRGQEKEISTRMAVGNAAARATSPVAALPEEPAAATLESTVPSGTGPETLTETALYRSREEVADVRSTGFSRIPGEEPPKGGSTNGALVAAGGIIAERFRRPGVPAANAAWRVLRSVDFRFRRMVGEENEILRYFIWAVSVVLLLMAGALGTGAGLRALTVLLAKQTAQEPTVVESANDSSARLKLRPIAPQTIEAGRTLKVAVTVDNAAAPPDGLRYSLAGKTPIGAAIVPETGHLTWTPAADQPPGSYDLRVSAETADGRRDETAFRITVTAPVPLKLKSIEPQTVEAGKVLTVPVVVENAQTWQGKVRYSLGSHPAGSRIGAESGTFTWTPTADQTVDKHDVTVSVTGPDGRGDETTFVVNVLRPTPPLRLQAIRPQTVEAGKPLSVTVFVENAEAWKGKLRYSLGPQPPPGASITAQSGEFSWTPPPDQTAGKHDVTISVQGPDGQMAQTTFVLTVTRPPPPALKEIAVDVGNGVKLELVMIPAGEFMMGSPDSDAMARGEEKPQHRVRITKPFYLGKYLVTQQQWHAVMGNNPSHFKGLKNPVEQVDWADCQQFFDKLNAKSVDGGGKFQLPSEAQWEYACRAGSTTRYCFGDEESGLGEYAWYGANLGGRTHPVGEKEPNAWGLYDMHGNVWEWCADWYDSIYYGKSPTDDPTGPTTGSYRVSRGGCWYYPAGLCRSAGRYFYGPGIRYFFLGFRASLVPADK